MRELLNSFILLVFAALPRAWADESAHLAFSHLEFDRPTEIAAVIPPARGLGPTGSIQNGTGGWGLTLEIPQTDKLIWWGQMSYGTETPLLNTQFDDHKDGFQTQFFNMNVKDRIAISTGFDRQFPVDRRHKWAFVTGVGASLARSHVEMTSYPKLCGLWCGFDQTRPSHDSKIDVALLSYLRLGLKINDIGNSGFNSALYIVTRPLRYPKFVELDTIQDGRKQVNPHPDGYFQIETTYRF